MRRPISRLPALLILPALLSLPIARAAAPTGEEDRMADQIAGRWPQQLSQNGAWLVHVDNQGRLTRRRAAPPHDISHTMQVPSDTRVISASRSAAKVALTTSDGCVGVMTLTGEPGAPKQQWLPTALLGPGEAGRLCPPLTGPDPRAKPERLYRPHPVAISADGTRVALVGDRVVRLIDTDRFEVLHDLPVGPERVLQLRFIDSGRKLLVASARLGEQPDGPSLGSELHIGIWNTRTGELHNLHRTDPQPALLAEDLLWDYSDTSGLLWLPHTGGRRPAEATAGPHRPPIRAYAISLKRCSALPQQPLSLPVTEGGTWLEWAADPHGRWVAAVEIHPDRPGASRLNVWETWRGTSLLSMSIEAELRSLTVSADGRWLYGMRSGKPSATQLTQQRQGWSFPNGGQWQAQAIDVPPPPATQAAWADSPCPLSDETSVALEPARRPETGAGH